MKRQNPRDVHFQDAGYKALGAEVATQKGQETAQGTAATIFKRIIQQAGMKLEKDKAGKNQPTEEKPGATEKPAATDPFQVPTGSIEELFKYAEGLKREHCKENNYSAILEFRRKAALAMVEAADKILAAKPTAEQTAAAIRLKLEAFSALPLSVVNEAIIAKLEALVAQAEKNELPKEARQARRVLLAFKLASARKSEELDEIIGKVKDFFQAGPVDSSSIHLAVNTGRAAESSGRSDLAVKTYRDLAEIFAAQKEKELIETAAKFEGAVRRMELTEKPMIIEGTTFDGKPLDWSKYAGKVVLIDFWATWCGPCRAELPNVKKNYEAYHDRGFEVVGISLDQKREDLEKFIEKEKLPWTIVLDASWSEAAGDQPALRKLANYYGVFGIPTAILLGKDGKAISLRARGNVLSSELEKALGPTTDEKKN